MEPKDYQLYAFRRHAHYGKTTLTELQTVKFMDKDSRKIFLNTLCSIYKAVKAKRNME
jgi:hypothetical protein